MEPMGWAWVRFMMSRLMGPTHEWAKLLVATKQPCLHDPKQFCTLLKLAYLPYLYEDSPEDFLGGG